MKLLAACALTCLLCSGAFASLSVTLRPAATVRQEQITVGDVADLTGSDAQTTAARAVVLGPSPVVGASRTLRRDQIAWRLAQSQVSATVAGATNVSVTRVVRTVTAAELDQAAQECLRQATGADGGELSLTLLSPAHDASVPDGPLQIAGTLSGPALGTQRAILVTVTCGERVVHTQTLRYRMQRQADVAIAARPLRAGESLTTSDWSVQHSDVAGLAGRPLAPAEMEGRRLRHSISAGAVLTVENTEPMPLVLRGHAVTVSVLIGAVTVTCDGIAQSDGAAGEVIKILNPTSKEFFTATVSGPGRVEIAN